MNWAAIAKQVVTTLVESGHVEKDRAGSATAVALASLKNSPPDIAKDYNAAKLELLGDKDEVLK